MAEKATKKNPAKSGAAPEAGVLAALPATRPTRLSKRARPSAAKAAAEAPAAKAAPAPKRSAKPAAKRAAAKRKPRAAKPKAATAPPAGVSSISDGPNKPRPVRSASSKLADPARKSAAARGPHRDAPSGTELVTTVVQAAGELAQVGLTVSGQLIKRAVQRIPKP